MGFYLKSWNGEPADLDPREEVEGHVPGLTKDKIRVLKSENVMVDRFLMREIIMRGTEDKTNTYITHFAKLPDGETYACTVWVKPSEVEAHGGVDPLATDGLHLPESLIKEVRGNALKAFAQSSKGLKK